MANAVTKVNGIAIADIAKISGQNDSDLAKLNALEFTGTIPDAHTLISTATSDGSDASLGFTSGIDSTYDVYEFVYTNIHPETDAVHFGWQVNAASGSNTSGFDQIITSTHFNAYHSEDDSATTFAYKTNYDQANGTALEQLSYDMGADADQALSGILTIYAPSSTTYVKHFISRTNFPYNGDLTIDWYTAGYINAEEAMDEIEFKMSSGEIQGGEIKMYGLAKS